MLLIVIILFVAYIVIPLVDLAVKDERIKFAAKLVSYLATFLYVLYVLITTRLVV